jgi:hypothetical protein
MGTEAITLCFLSNAGRGRNREELTHFSAGSRNRMTPLRKMLGGKNTTGSGTTGAARWSIPAGSTPAAVLTCDLTPPIQKG